MRLERPAAWVSLSVGGLFSSDRRMACLRRASLGIEALESRQLLSVAPASAEHAALRAASASGLARLDATLRTLPALTNHGHHAGATIPIGRGKPTAATALPDLAPFTPPGWSGPVVVSTTAGVYTDATTILPTQTLYIDTALNNVGQAPTPSTLFNNEVLIDGNVAFSWHYSGVLNPNSNFTYLPDQSVGSFAPGQHTLSFVVNYTNAFAESNTTNNTYSRTFVVSAAPAMTTQPQNQSVVEGNAVSFTAAASGYPAPAVQWQVSSDGGVSYSPIPGATASTLSFTASPGQNGNLYEAVFTNGIGSVTSSAASLSVTPLPAPPAITTQPVAQNLTAGATATFTAAASGYPAPAVQWQQSTNGGASFAPIAGATSTTCSFTANAWQSGYQYEAVFTNSQGSAATNAVALTVANNANLVGLSVGKVNVTSSLSGTVTGYLDVTLTAPTGASASLASYSIEVDATPTGGGLALTGAATPPGYVFNSQTPTVVSGSNSSSIIITDALPAGQSATVTNGAGLVRVPFSIAASTQAMFAVSLSNVALVDGQGKTLSIGSANPGAVTVVADIPPTVTGVSFGSDKWAGAFPYVGGFPMPTGAAQLATLPWVNLDQVSIKFNENVNVTQAALAVRGVNVASYAASGFAYNTSTFTATWTFGSAFAADKLLLDLAASGANAVSDPVGTLLDGSWTNGSSAFPSGNGTPGGADFKFQANILPGDIDQKGSVNITEVIHVRNDQLAVPGGASYSPLYDVDGSGKIDILDVIDVRNRQLTALPSGTPSVQPAAASPVAVIGLSQQGSSAPAPSAAGGGQRAAVSSPQIPLELDEHAEHFWGILKLTATVPASHRSR